MTSMLPLKSFWSTFGPLCKRRDH